MTDGPAVDAPVAVAPGVTLVRAPNPGPMTLDGTNTYVLDSPAGALVVDPGPVEDPHLAAVVAAATAAGPVAAVVLTHSHADHSAGAARLAALTGAPVYARHGDHGDPLPAGEVLAGVLLVLDAPGHTSDSVCFRYRRAAQEPEYLLTGDTVLGRGTTVVSHPDGRLGDYLRTLDVLRDVVEQAGTERLLPGHGPVRSDPRELLDFYRSHRRERLAEIRAAIAAGDRSPEEVVRRVYADVDRVLWPAARRSVQAQLDFLAEHP